MLAASVAAGDVMTSLECTSYSSQSQLIVMTSCTRRHASDKNIISTIHLAEITTRNTSTGLPSLSTTICCHRSAIFRHLARLGDEVPAHKELHSCVRLSQGRLPDPTWKRRPGRPRGRWIVQLRRDNNRPPANQWKLVIKRGHGGRATLWSNDYATT